MNNARAFGTYMQGNSCVHQMNAQVKIILACVFSISIFFVSSWAGMLCFSLLVVAGYLVSQIKIAQALNGLLPVLLILLFTVLAHVVVGGTQELPPVVPWLQVPEFVMDDQAAKGLVRGLVSGVFFALRIALLVAACCLLTFTTSPTQVMKGLRSLLAPLELLKLPVDDLCLVISIALRFVPIITDEAMSLKRSYEVRGASFQGLVNSLRSWSRLLIPLLVRLFKRADTLARALEARCYGVGKRQTLHEEAMTLSQVLWCVAGTTSVIAIAVLL